MFCVRFSNRFELKTEKKQFDNFKRILFIKSSNMGDRLDLPNYSINEENPFQQFYRSVFISTKTLFQ